MTVTTQTNTLPANPKPVGRSDRAAHRWIEPLDILVLAGGPSMEREVSLKSGAAVYKALAQLGHRPILRDISPDDLSSLDIPVDFVFITLHGEFGEDGRIQEELDRRRIRYSGCGAGASRTAMNKVETKKLAHQAGVPTPEFELVTKENLKGLSTRFATPAFVKPVESGSSVDMCRATSPQALQHAAENLVKKYGQALIEAFVRGPEFTVGILGDTALPVCEIRTKREFYDYDAKYVDDDTQYLFDLSLDPDTVRRLQDLSLRVHDVLGCRVLSRIDWMVDEKNNEPYLLEVNTIPGFTSHSLVPKAAERVGLNFAQLCQRVIELSLASF